MKPKYWVLTIVCFLILFVDQWTKYVVEQKIALYQKVEVIHGFFNLVHVGNTGGAFGIFGGERGGLGSLFFVAVSLVAIGSILFLFVRLKEDEKTLPLSLSLILSGAIGNLVDRFWHGEVVDFLDFYISSYHWPAFNIADSAICVGIGLMAIALLVQDHRKSKFQSACRRQGRQANVK
jgi:signal peptidase II